MWGSSCLPECCSKRDSPRLWCLCLLSSHSLKMRTFSTFDFYRKHEDAMTPAGLAFFQCQWDSSVTWVFHQLLSKNCTVQGCWGGRACEGWDMALRVTHGASERAVAGGACLVPALVLDLVQHRLVLPEPSFTELTAVGAHNL